MKIIGINRGLIKVIVDNQEIDIQGEVILENEKYVFYAYENSIKNWTIPYMKEVTDEEKRILIYEIIKYSEDKEIKIIFE